MQKFKINESVKCVDNSNANSDLTKDKIYKIIEDHHKFGYVGIFGDNNRMVYYWDWRFAPANCLGNYFDE